MLALATDGRWLGGQPNYGYQIVDTGRPHPNRSKGAAGVRLRTLGVDPTTAPVVLRCRRFFCSPRRVARCEHIPTANWGSARLRKKNLDRAGTRPCPVDAKKWGGFEPASFELQTP